MNFMDEYRDKLIALVDINAPQVINIKYNPTARWDALRINVVPTFDPMVNLKDVFLSCCVEAAVVLTTENNKLVNKVLIQCNTDSIYYTCTSMIRSFYIDHCGLSSKKLRNDSTYDWLNDFTNQYRLEANAPFHKEIFGIAKYIYDTKREYENIPADHQKNILALIQLLQRKMGYGTKK